MGMSASQARFLCLTARKNNVEFEGQQINQQRTTLSNESASYYSELCNLVVPTPPSVDDFTKITYTFDDGALTNTITSMIAKENNKYSISYIQQWQDDYSIVSAASSVITKSQNAAGADVYKIGSATLRQLGSLDLFAEGANITIEGQKYEIKVDEKGAYIDRTSDVPTIELCSQEDIANFEYYIYNGDDETMTQVYKNTNGSFYTVDENGNQATLNDITENDLIICLYDSTQTDPEKAVLLVDKDEETGEYFKEWYNKQYLTAADLSVVCSTDSYIASLTPEQVSDLMEQEKYYQNMLNDKYYSSDQQWYVRYIKDSTTGSYTPYFYNADDVENESKYSDDGIAIESMACFSIGSATKTKEVINALGSVEKDSTGRYISIILYKTDENGQIVKNDKDGSDLYTQYSLVTNTSTDEEAYNDAMNKYNYQQYQYDQKVQEINSKIEVVQQQDKSLELKLKSLDTEESAIQAEVEAVKKVISKNVDSSFKTFSA